MSPSWIDPETSAPLVPSCKRFSARSSVVFPDPDGPINEVTRWAGIAIETSLTAGERWNDTLTCSRRIAAGVSTTTPSSGARSTASSVGGVGSDVMKPSFISTSSGAGRR